MPEMGKPKSKENMQETTSNSSSRDEHYSNQNKARRNKEIIKERCNWNLSSPSPWTVVVLFMNGCYGRSFHCSCRHGTGDVFKSRSACGVKPWESTSSPCWQLSGPRGDHIKSIPLSSTCAVRWWLVGYIYGANPKYLKLLREFDILSFPFRN